MRTPTGVVTALCARSRRGDRRSSRAARRPIPRPGSEGYAEAPGTNVLANAGVPSGTAPAG